MSEIRVNNIKNEAGSGAPSFPNGAVVTGVITATTFVGALTGTASTATTVDITNTNGLTTIYYPTFVENRTDGQILRGDVDLTYRTDDNILTVPKISSTEVTATTFIGALTGNSTGLSGSPSITVGNATVTGDLTVQGTTTTIDTVNLVIGDKNIGIGTTTAASNTTADGGGITIFGGSDGDKTLTYNNTKKAFETNVAFSPNENRFITGAEKTVIVSGNTASLTYNSSSANVAICTNATGNITLSVVGIPTSSDFDNHAVTFTVIATSTSGVARTCTAVNMNGVSKTIKWAGGSLANAISGLTTTSGYTIFGFTGINTVGSATSTANYEVFGVASGGFF